MPEDIDITELLNKLDGLKETEEKAPAIQEDPKAETEKQVVEPKKEINPNLTSNEKARARNFGTELFNGGMKPLTDIQKQQREKNKMSTKPKGKGINMKGFLGKLLGGIGKIFSVPLLIMSLIQAIPEIIDGVLKFLGKWFLPIILGIMLFVSILKNPETWKKLANKILDAIKSAWDWITGPGWEMLKEFFIDLWNWISDPELWAQVGEWVRNAVNQICDGLLAAVDWLCDLLSDPEFWSAIWDAIVWYLELWWDVMTTYWKFLWDVACKILPLLGKFIVWLGKILWDGIVWVGEKIGEFFVWLADIISEWWAENVSRPLSKWWNEKIVKPVAAWFKSIKDWFNNIVNKVKEHGSNFINKFKNFWEMIKSIPDRIWNGMRNLIDSVKEKFLSITDPITNKFSGFIDGFKDRASGMIDAILYAIPNKLGGISKEEYQKREKERARRAKARENGENTPAPKKEVPKSLVTPQAAPVQGTIDIRDIQKLNQTDIDKVVHNNYMNNNSTNLSNSVNNAGQVAIQPNPNNINIVPVTTTPPTVNVEAANDEIQHDLTKKQTKQIEELNSTMKVIAEKEENSGNITNMTVVNNSNGTSSSHKVVMHKSANDKDALKLRGASMA